MDPKQLFYAIAKVAALNLYRNTYRFWQPWMTSATDEELENSLKRAKANGYRPNSFRKPSDCLSGYLSFLELLEKTPTGITRKDIAKALGVSSINILSRTLENAELIVLDRKCKRGGKFTLTALGKAYLMAYDYIGGL